MLLAGPMPFRHHALAVLGAATLGATVVTSVWTAGLFLAAHGHSLGAIRIAAMALACWLGILLVALPCSGLVFSLLWPVTRRGTIASGIICILAGVAMGVTVAPLWSPNLRGAGPGQLAVFALAGATVAGCYLLVARRLGRPRPPNADIFA